MAQTPALMYAEGDVIDYTPSGAAVVAGDVVVIGSRPLIAPSAIADGVKGVLATTGVWKVPQKAEAQTAGNAVHVDLAGGDEMPQVQGFLYPGPVGRHRRRIVAHPITAVESGKGLTAHPAIAIEHGVAAGAEVVRAETAAVLPWGHMVHLLLRQKEKKNRRDHYLSRSGEGSIAD